jgi:ABC-type protease/lipase transport system fused ATPase/permease subunit
MIFCILIKVIKDNNNDKKQYIIDLINYAFLLNIFFLNCDMFFFRVYDSLNMSKTKVEKIEI